MEDDCARGSAPRGGLSSRLGLGVRPLCGAPRELHCSPSTCRTHCKTRPTASLALLKDAGTEAELGLLSLRQWLQRRRLHGHDHRGQFWRLRHGHDRRGCGPERDAEGVPMLLRHHAVRERFAARLETVGRAFRARRINGLHRHGAAGERANRRREG
jgi:hypothetical protein